ncbi:MAG: carbon-nitrogen hydrolase family protein [Acidimicrobiales bacterium]
MAVAQPLSLAGDLAGNAERHALAIRAAKSQVVLFPELSLTGYDLASPTVDLNDRCLVAIVDACRETDSLALVGAPTAGDAGESYISTLAINSDRVAVAYRKIWLGDQEKTHFTAGTAPAVLTVGGWRLGLAICKDSGAAQHATDTAALGIDVYAAGLVEAAEDFEVVKQRAQRVAGDHDIWVAIASFAGPTGGGFDKTAGRSGIWRADGSLAAHSNSEPGSIARATLHQTLPNSLDADLC